MRSRQMSVCVGDPSVGAHEIHDELIRLIEGLPCDRIGEPAHGVQAVGIRPALADKVSCGPGSRLGHLSSLPVQKETPAASAHDPTHRGAS
jgi:hypothetical protein